MTEQESSLINALFDKLDQTVHQQHVDPAAETLIKSRIASNLNAPYLLTQSTLVFQQALTAAQEKITRLEQQISQSAPQKKGFLSGLTNLFETLQSPPSQSRTASNSLPVPQQQFAPPSNSGGFLKGALSTAAGVAGGALLFQGIENLFGNHLGGSLGGMGMGSGGFLDNHQPTEVINNYYDSPAPNDASDGNDFADNSFDTSSSDQGSDWFDNSDDSSFT